MDSCATVGCDRPVYVKKRGLCKRHYEAWWKADQERPACSVDGCDTPRRRQGMCELHSDRLRRTGTVEPRIMPTLEERLMSKVEKGDGCWLWTRTVGSSGYGQINANGCLVLAHRLSYELFVGPIPKGADIDHQCHNPAECAGGLTCPHRRCVNPKHLRAMTHQQNMQRGKSANRAKTHCKRGHEFTPENTYRTTQKGRGCRACRRKSV